MQTSLSGRRQSLLAFSGLGLGLLLPPTARLDAAPGATAPQWRLTDARTGTALPFGSFKGNWIALEWTNPNCPFVQKHYNTGNLQTTQRDAADRGIVWVQVNSTAASHRDYLDARAMVDWNAAQKSVVRHITLDTSGETGRAYGAQTTPQLVLISLEGQVVFNGAIDSIRSANPADVKKATNYMRQAMAEALAGKPIREPAPQPYGCSIKY